MKLLKFIFKCICLSSLFLCYSCSGDDSSKYDNDEKYWESINKEQKLRDAGLDGAANIERKARREYMKGGGYTSPSGERQIHYKGSKEQQRDLNMIDEYMRENPDF